MNDPFPMSETGRGRISDGPTDALIERTLEFVRAELAGWRGDPDRAPEEAEERLNAQLCKYLNVAATHRFPMVHFSHEEKQTGTRRVDMSALPISGGFIGQTYYTIYDPFLVFEGKRLPAPSRSREREYVTGGAEKSGGIQRFKLALHGAQQTTAAMIGYIQKDDVASWWSLINRWIREVASDTAALDEKWSVDEQLTDLASDHALHIASSSSVHKRSEIAISPAIDIRHLWVVMQN
jgi:hypothetical protein